MQYVVNTASEGYREGSYANIGSNDSSEDNRRSRSVHSVCFVHNHRRVADEAGILEGSEPQRTVVYE